MHAALRTSAPTALLAWVAIALTGCSVVGATVAVGSAAVSVGASAVSLAADATVGAVRLTGKAVGAAADAVTPGETATPVAAIN